ncbi:hypothetical protein JD77_05877 [Micromonospora olivasterospora]|uniref:Uncharacterized protein n=1 Tax=Micromonospora olivasterospora TaxID=1880 RepID=A0A562IIX5_MICOL|nr:hypothetical protein JD77_05877 [Micromonospora olivasterospora]
MPFRLGRHQAAVWVKMSKTTEQIPYEPAVGANQATQPHAAILDSPSRDDLFTSDTS